MPKRYYQIPQMLSPHSGKFHLKLPHGLGNGEYMDDRDFLEFAIAAARQGAAEGGVPIGGALVVDGQVLGTGYNKRVQLGSAIRHGTTSI